MEINKIIKSKTYFFVKSYLFYFRILLFHLLVLGCQIFILFLNDEIDVIKSHYAFWLDFFLFIVVCCMIRHFYFKSNEIIKEVIEKLKRIDNENEEIVKFAEYDLYEIRRNTFDFKKIISYGFWGGGFVSSTVLLLNVYKDYPYLLFHFLFGFYHGVGLLFVINWIRFSKVVSKNYIKTIDVFDPDRMGGFSNLKSLFLQTTILLLFILTLDYFILLNAFNNSSENFRTVVQSCFIIAIIANLLVLAYSYSKIRRTILIYKNQKKKIIVEKFNEIEDRFLKNLSNEKDVSSDVQSLLGLKMLYEYCNKMNLSPLSERIIYAMIVVIGWVAYNIDLLKDIINLVVSFIPIN